MRDEISTVISAFGGGGRVRRTEVPMHAAEEGISKILVSGRFLQFHMHHSPVLVLACHLEYYEYGSFLYWGAGR